MYDGSCPESALILEFISSSETIRNMFPTAHIDYEEFTKAMTSLVI